MTQTIIFMDEKENNIVNEYSKKWDLNKVEVVKKIIRDFEED